MPLRSDRVVSDSSLFYLLPVSWSYLYGIRRTEATLFDFAAHLSFLLLINLVMDLNLTWTEPRPGPIIFPIRYPPSDVKRVDRIRNLRPPLRLSHPSSWIGSVYYLGFVFYKPSTKSPTQFFPSCSFPFLVSLLFYCIISLSRARFVAASCNLSHSALERGVVSMQPERAREAAAGPSGEEAKAEGEEHEAILARAQRLISKIVETQANPNPRHLHALATILEAQESRYLPFSSIS